MISLRQLLILLTVSLGLVFLSGQDADAKMLRRNSASQRRAIRSMPILNRPNRPLHFYGNTVRWLHNRRR